MMPCIFTTTTTMWVKQAGRHFSFFKKAGRHQKGAGRRALRKRPRQNTAYACVEFPFYAHQSFTSVLLHGSETWNLTIRDCNRLNAFDMSCLRRLENVKWYHHVRNSTIRQRTKQHLVSITLTQRRLRWFGHLQRMPPENEVLKLHNFSPGTIGWTRPRGRPRRRWMDCVSQDIAVIDIPLAEAVRIAHHRIAVTSRSSSCDLYAG